MSDRNSNNKRMDKRSYFKPSKRQKTSSRKKGIPIHIPTNNGTATQTPTTSRPHKRGIEVIEIEDDGDDVYPVGHDGGPSTSQRQKQAIEIIDIDDDDDKQVDAPSNPSNMRCSDLPSNSHIEAPRRRILQDIKNLQKNVTNKSIKKPERAGCPSRPPHRPRHLPSPTTPSPGSIDPNEEVLIYPFNCKKSVIVTNRDISRLNNKQSGNEPDNKFYLNDSIMDAYTKMLQDEHPKDQIHVFSSLFFTKLASPNNNRSTDKQYEGVKRWTDKINIFEKEFVIIPIQQNNHWFLAIITNPGCCVGRNPGAEEHKPVKKAYITLLDSLGKDHHSCYQQICKYLKAEAVHRLKIDPADFKDPECKKGRGPIQDNGYDCGVYCLYCIKGLYENPRRIRPSLTCPQPNNDKHWVPSLANQFREKLRSIFKNKAKEYKAYQKEQHSSKQNDA